MKVIVETKRLLLREFKPSDARAMYDLNSDPEVMRYTGDVYFKSVEESRELIINYPDYNKNGFGRNAIILKKTGEFLGWCGLKKLEDGTVDIGYRFLKRNWNKGYATESAKAILTYGFRHYGLKEVIGNASLKNGASVRVFEKLGMKFYRKQEYDGLKDAVQYKIDKEAFLKYLNEGC